MFRPSVLTMEGYSAPQADRMGFYRHDANEATIHPSPRVREALQRFLEHGVLSVYPEPSILHRKLGAYLGIDPACVRATDGADAALMAISYACVGPGDKVIIPSPSFGMMYIASQAQGARIIQPQYGLDMRFPLKEVCDAIDQDTRLVMICSPNNPTGTLLDREGVETVLQRASGIAVLVDEVYAEFAGVTMVDLVQQYDHLFVVKSFSKAWALAGARVGYIVSQSQNIEQLRKIIAPFDVNQLGIVAATAALDDVAYMRNYVAEVMQRAKPLLEDYLRRQGIPFHAGAANFLLIELDHPQKVAQALRDEGRVLVRPQHGALQRMIRVAVGTVEDTERFITAFDKVTKRLRE